MPMTSGLSLKLFTGGQPHLAKSSQPVPVATPLRRAEAKMKLAARNMVSSALEWLIMPTDLGVVSECKRKAAQAQAQTEVTILLVFVIISLAMLVLLVADQSFSKAKIELIGHLAP
jgi:hypothetical protein